PTPSSPLFPYTTLFRSHLSRIHAWLYHLERDPLIKWLFPLGFPNNPHAPFTDLLEEFIRANTIPRPLPNGNGQDFRFLRVVPLRDRKSTRLNSSHVASS